MVSLLVVVLQLILLHVYQTWEEWSYIAQFCLGWEYCTLSNGHTGLIFTRSYIYIIIHFSLLQFLFLWSIGAYLFSLFFSEYWQNWYGEMSCSGNSCKYSALLPFNDSFLVYFLFCIPLFLIMWPHASSDMWYCYLALKILFMLEFWFSVFLTWDIIDWSFATINWGRS